MKAKVIFSCYVFLLISITLRSQEPLSYSEVIQVDSFSQGDLYQRARAWFNKAFVSSQNVLNIQDKESGELSGKGTIQYKSKVFRGSAVTSGNVRFIVAIKCKDGRYKFTFTDFRHEGSSSYSQYTGHSSAWNVGLIMNTDTCPYNYQGGANWNNKVWKDIRTQIDEQIPPIIENLKAFMRKPPEDNW